MDIHKRLQALALSGVLILTVVSVSGCGSLLNPHVRWDPPMKNATSNQPKSANEITLADAIDYANRAKAAYADALGE